MASSRLQQMSTAMWLKVCCLLAVLVFINFAVADDAEYDHKVAILEQYAQSSVLQMCCETLPDEGPECIARSESEALLGCTLDTLGVIRTLFHSGHKDWPPRFSVLSYATSNIHEYAGYSLSLNAAYCSTHGYSFQILGPRDGAEYEPRDQRWNKVRILLEALDGGSNASQSEWVLWLDADLAVIEPTLDLEALVELAPGADIFVCSDNEKAEIFSLVNTGAVLVRNTEWTRDFLRHWWGDSASRQASWDQHAFTRLYLGQDARARAGGSTTSTSTSAELLAETTSTESSQDWSAAAVQEHIHLLPADALNTRRPATLHHHKDCPVLHMVGALNAHRAQVFKEAWSNACEYSKSVLMKSLVTPALKPQLGLTKQRLVQIESTLLGGRFERAEELVNVLTQLPGDSLLVRGSMDSLRSKMRTVMKLGDPRVGATKDTSMVAQAMKHYYKLLKRHVSANDVKAGEAHGSDRASLELGMELELHHEMVDMAFELALPPAKPFYVRTLMTDIAPVVELLGRHSINTPGRVDTRAAFYDFKRLQFVSQSYSALGGPPDSATDRIKQQEALEQALAVWERIVGSDTAAAAAERGSSRSALVEEGAEILDSLAILRCMEKRNLDGLALAQRGASLLEKHWGLHKALQATRQGLVDSSPVGLELVPPAILVSLATTYRNMAVCASENEDKVAALKYYLNAALLRSDLLLVHGQATTINKESAIEYDESPSSQRAQRQHSLGQQVKEESEQELTELVYRISSLAGNERNNGMAALESRLGVLKRRGARTAALSTEKEASNNDEVHEPVQVAKPTQAEAAAKPATEEPPAAAVQPQKKKLMRKKKRNAPTAADEL